MTELCHSVARIRHKTRLQGVIKRTLTFPRNFCVHNLVDLLYVDQIGTQILINY